MELTIPQGAYLDLGFSVRRSRALIPPEGTAFCDHHWRPRKGTAAEQWIHWNQVAEEFLISATQGTIADRTRGRGLKLSLNNHGAQQDPVTGAADNKEAIALRYLLSVSRRLEMYSNKADLNWDQTVEYESLQRRHAGVPSTQVLKAQLEEAVRKLRSKRTQSWTHWCRTQWNSAQGKIYRYIRPPDGAGIMESLHHGSASPPCVP